MTTYRLRFTIAIQGTYEIQGNALAIPEASQLMKWGRDNVKCRILNEDGSPVNYPKFVAEAREIKSTFPIALPESR